MPVAACGNRLVIKTGRKKSRPGPLISKDYDFAEKWQGTLMKQA
jgi:hypothetical protein